MYVILNVSTCGCRAHNVVDSGVDKIWCEGYRGPDAENVDSKTSKASGGRKWGGDSMLLPVYFLLTGSGRRSGRKMIFSAF